MAQLTVLIAGLLLLAESQASDVVEQGFLSKQQDAADYNKFILPAVSNVKIGNGPHALSYHNNLAEHSSAVPEMSANSFTVIDDKDVNSGMEQPTEIPIFSAIGVGLLAFVTMLGAHDLLVYFIQRSLQPVDMSAGSSDNIMEMSSQGPGVGWGQQSSLNSRPLTLCYATPDEAPEGTYLGTSGGPFDPLGTYESSARKAEINNGRLAMVSITSLGGRPAGRNVRSSTALGVFGKTRASQRKFVPAVSQSELSPGKAVSGICAGLDICIAVDTDGSVYALGNKSPVLGTPMAA